MVGPKNTGSDRPPALEQYGGDEGGCNTTRPSEPTATAGNASTPQQVLEAVERAFREAADAHLERVRRALTSAMTPQLIEDVEKFAETRAKMVKKTGRPCPRPEHYAKELVQDAYTDTWLGDLAWEPDLCPLDTHLRMAIKDRTRKQVTRAPKHVPIDAPLGSTANEDGEPVVVADVFASSGDLSAIRTAALVGEVCRELAQATAADLDCLDVLRAWQHGLVERNEVRRFTALSPAAYKRARHRLMYAASSLPTELRQLVQDYLRSAS